MNTVQELKIKSRTLRVQISNLRMLMTVHGVAIVLGALAVLGVAGSLERDVITFRYSLILLSMLALFLTIETICFKSVQSLQKTLTRELHAVHMEIRSLSMRPKIVPPESEVTSVFQSRNLHHIS